MRLLEMHESFIDQARRVSLPVRPPVSPRRDGLPVVAREKWTEAGDPPELVKAFVFRRREDRLRFLEDLFEFEDKVGHHASRTVVEPDVITLHLRTHDVDKVTELDKELARFADAAFQDITLSGEF